jgi:hypothetical protein
MLAHIEPGENLVVAGYEYLRMNRDSRIKLRLEPELSSSFASGTMWFIVETRPDIQHTCL